MRDIKFRAWDSRNKQLVYSGKEDAFYINTKGVLFMYAIPKSESGAIGFTEYHKSYVVDRFTGLQDSKGSDIYENDVLQSYHFTDSKGKDNYINHIVKWSDRFNGWFALNAESMSEDDGSIQLFTYKRANKCSMRVIGNIYENPELLGE
mgnify:CR=1 FL=1